MYEGGFTGLGSDVSIFTLATPIANIDPIAVAATPPSQADVGSQFIGIGYGIQDAAGTTGTRKMGNITLRAVTGAPAPMVWPNADAYLASLEAEMTAGTTLTDDQKNQIKAEYSAPMSDGYEVYVGGAPNDSQICHGDSGGPLLRKEANGKYMVHGVTSTTMDQTGNPPVCKSGGIYTVFGANTRDVIAKQIGEHCGLDASAKFQCGLAAAPATCTAPSLQPDASASAAPPSALEVCLQGSCCAEANDCFGDKSCNTLSDPLRHLRLDRWRPDRAACLRADLLWREPAGLREVPRLRSLRADELRDGARLGLREQHDDGCHDDDLGADRGACLACTDHVAASYGPDYFGRRTTRRRALRPPPA